jgi:hypothetical protein
MRYYKLNHPQSRPFLSPTGCGVTAVRKNGGVIEVKMDRMYFDVEGVSSEPWRICHEENRRRDPYKTRINKQEKV